MLCCLSRVSLFIYNLHVSLLEKTAQTLIGWAVIPIKFCCGSGMSAPGAIGLSGRNIKRKRHPQKTSLANWQTLSLCQSKTLLTLCILFHFRGTKEYRIRVRRPQLQEWIPFASGTLPDPNTNTTAPLVTAQGSVVIVKAVEFSCLDFYGWYCALHYFELGYL